MQLWLSRLNPRRSASHRMLTDDDCDSKLQGDRPTDVEAAKKMKPGRYDRNQPTVHTPFTTVEDTEVATDLRTRHSGLDVDGGECRIGNAAFSSYCCVVLVIFAVLFTLIGCVLTYAITRHSDNELVQFLNKHHYLRVASPFMICLGLVMLVLALIFAVVKRCRRPGSRPCNPYANSYFPPEVSEPPHSMHGSLAHLKGRNSMGSSRAISPLLAPSSGGASDKADWKWPSQASVAAPPPPLGSFPITTSTSSLVPLDHVVPTKEQPREPQGLSTTVSSELIPNVKAIPVSGSELPMWDSIG